MPPLEEQTLRQGNIMVVDDNPANLKLLEDMLRLQGYDVRSFHGADWRLRRLIRTARLDLSWASICQR